MSSKNKTEQYQEDIEYFTDYAREDWVPVHNIFVAANHIAGAEANLQKILWATEKILQDLFRQGVQLGDLTAEDPGFQRWGGTHNDWLARIRISVESQGDIPIPGELAWLHIPEKDDHS